MFAFISQTLILFIFVKKVEDFNELILSSFCTGFRTQL